MAVAVGRVVAVLVGLRVGISIGLGNGRVAVAVGRRVAVLVGLGSALPIGLPVQAGATGGAVSSLLPKPEQPADMSSKHVQVTATKAVREVRLFLFLAIVVGYYHLPDSDCLQRE